MNNENYKRIVGTRSEQRLIFDARADLFLKGVAFNEQIHKTFGTKDNGVPKGLYHFKSHEEANKHQDECIAQKMAIIAKERNNNLII